MDNLLISKIKPCWNGVFKLLFYFLSICDSKKNLALLGNKLGRKRVWTGIHQRKYVVLKSLLRKIHSFYWRDINNETNYMKHKKKRGVHFYEACLKQYIQWKFNEEPTDGFVLTLGALACWGDMQDLLVSKFDTQLTASYEFDEQQLEIVNHIKEALHKFSFLKYCFLAKRPGMFSLMAYFSSQKEHSLSHDERIGFQILFEKCINQS